MGPPVIHFEVVWKDGEGLQRYYADLFGWEIDANNPMRYGTVPRYTRGDDLIGVPEVVS